MASRLALNLGDDWFEGLNEKYLRRRNLVFELFDQLSCQYEKDQSGMFVWAKCSEGTGEAISDEVLMKYKIFITPGMIFGSAGDQYLRISLCTTPERMEEAILRLKS